MRVYAPRKRVAVVCRDGVVPTQEDACTIPCELNSMKPDTLRRSKPSPDLLKLCARCLGATDTLVKSPHAREKLGKALYDLFLPVNAKGKTYTELALYRQPLQENPGNVELLANASPEIAAKLCPAILWLFGDAEHIGDIYQIADQRLRIAALIKHLWDCLLYTSPSPRDATLSRMPSSA